MNMNNRKIITVVSCDALFVIQVDINQSTK
jgi:hypothetical protein